jgi:hypothetical protein
MAAYFALRMLVTTDVARRHEAFEQCIGGGGSRELPDRCCARIAGWQKRVLR